MTAYLAVPEKMMGFIRPVIPVHSIFNAPFLMSTESPVQMGRNGTQNSMSVFMPLPPAQASVVSSCVTCHN